MNIVRKAVNAYVWYFIIAFLGLTLSLVVMGFIHVIKFLIQGKVWI